MSFRSLRDYLAALERDGDLRRVAAPVSPHLEITEIARRLVRDGGPALLFEQVEGADFPLAINLFATDRRVERALGGHPAELGEAFTRLAGALQPPRPGALWRERATLRRVLAMRPPRLAPGPAQEVEEAPDLDRLPILTCWPGDGGPFLTFPLVLTRSPADGRRNLGTYRLHKFDARTTGAHWQIMKGGGYHYVEAERRQARLPMAVVLGGDPALMFAAVCPLPEGVDEVAFAGFLRGSPVPLARARSIPLEVPAEAEFILEGEVPPGERRLEGPFGDHFGHYSAAAPFPVFHLTRVTRRRDAIYPAIVVGQPPMEDKFLGDAVQRLFGPVLRVLHPELADLWTYYETGFHNLLVMSVDSRYAKEGVKTALSLLGEGQLGLTKVAVVVDPDVDVRDFGAVLRALGANFRPQEDFLLLPGLPLDTLDFTSCRMNLGSRMVLDATRRRDGATLQVVPEEPETTPEPAAGGGPGERARGRGPGGVDPRQVDPRIRAARVAEGVWLTVQVERDAREVLRKLLEAPLDPAIRFVAAVSPDVPLDDPVLWLWGMFTRFDAARDVFFERCELAGAAAVPRGRMALDATWKPGFPEPLSMTPEIVQRVDRRWREYGL
ncbi:MAG TPA: UbiD family decarboxylase [Candidatus Saccharimonadales bacterium]|nr:UbiD family decarboxylase [Candidatus Saccharimonadales bacterium]